MDTQKLIEVCIQKTQRWAKKYYSGNPKIRDGASLVKRVWDSDEDTANDLRNYLQKILQRRLPSADSDQDVEFENGVAVVPLGNDNDHSYQIGECVIIVDGNEAMEKDGDTEDQLTTTIGLVRPATESEIKKFITSLPKEGRETLKECYSAYDMRIIQKVEEVPTGPVIKKIQRVQGE
jgi:hypothetical protein